MSLEFSGLYVAIGEAHPKEEHVRVIFTDRSDEKYAIESTHYSVSTGRFDEDYYWIYVRYGNERPYTDTVLNVKKHIEEPNPRSKVQVEQDKQLFGLYVKSKYTFYVSNTQKKSFFEKYFAHVTGEDVVIKRIFISADEFLKKITTVEKLKFVVQENLFSSSGGFLSISPEHRDIFGLGMPHEYTIEGVFKGARKTPNFIHNFQNMVGWTKGLEAKSLVCVGKDDNNAEFLYNADSFTQKVDIPAGKDVYGLYSEKEVLQQLREVIGKHYHE